MLDLDARLRRYVEGLDEAYPDITVAEILGAAERPERLGAPRPRPRGWLVAAAAAAIVLVLVGGVALLARLVGEETPPVVTEPDVEIETDALPGPDDDVPPEFDPQARRALEEFLDGLGDAMAVETSLGTWTWRRVELVNAWRRTEPPVLPRPAPPELAVAGMQWQHPHGEDWSAARVGEVTVSVVPTGGVGMDWNEVYSGPGWVSAGWREHLALLEISAFEYREWVVFDVLEARVVPGDPEAVEFRRQDDGSLVLRLEATDPRMSAELLVQAAGGSCSGFEGCPLDLVSLFVETGDDGGVWVDPPWLGRPVVEAQVAAGADGFVLLAVEGTRATDTTARTMRWWVSSDGLEWDEVAQAAPVVVSAPGVEPVRLAGDGERLVLLSGDGMSVWTSTDASTWTRAQIDVRSPDERVGVGAARTSFGWMLLGNVGDGRVPWACVVWVSADAVLWERIPLLAVPVPAGLRSECHADVAWGPGGERLDPGTVLARAGDPWGFLATWLGSFDE